MSTPGTRFDWATTARGSRTVPVLLVAGLPAVFVPEGSPVTSCSLSGTVDSAWWPGGSADLSAVVKPWLSLAHGVSWSERARPADAQALEIGAVEITLADVAGAATELFSQRNSLVGTTLTQEVLAGDTILHVLDTSAFASAGVVHLGREAIAYSSKTSTTFASCTRGRYGSFDSRHVYSAGGGAVGVEIPEATDGPVDVVGRVASLWMCTVSGTAIVAAELAYIGHVGIDVTLASDGNGWVLRIDHAVHKIGQPIKSPMVAVAGYSHVGNRGVRGSTTRTPGNSALPLYGTCPLYVSVKDSGYSPVYQILLSDESADPDSGGWHASRESFLDAFNRASTALTGLDTLQGTLMPDGRLSVFWHAHSTGRIIDVMAPWQRAGRISTDSTTAQRTLNTADPMPDAWVPIDRDSRVYLTPGDYAAVPSVPTNPVTGYASHVELYYVLAIGADPARFVRYARITSMSSSGGVSYLTCNAIDPADVYVTPPTPGTPPLVRAGAAGFVVTTPTPARVSLFVAADDWVDGLQAVVAALDTDAGDGLSEAIDWNDMRRVVARYRPVFAASRRFVFDGEQTPLGWLVNEAALGGFALTIRRGRVTLVRVAEFAITEATDGTVVSADLSRDAAIPGFSRGSEPIINRFAVTWPGSKYSINVTDATSLSLYGYQRNALTATMPMGAVPPTWSAGALYNAVFALGMTALGPHRRPAETVEASAPLHLFGLSLGDVVDLSMWRVPNQSRGRGVSSIAGQVVSREPSLYGERSGVKLTLRMSPDGLSGWSPGIFVAAGGITGADVTADVSTFGASGTAPIGQNPTYGYAVGAKVRLIEIDSASPTTSTHHTVTAVTASLLSLSPSPNATFAGLAASALKVVVVPDDYDTAVAAQHVYAYLADRTTYTISSGVRARKLAA